MNNASAWRKKKLMDHWKQKKWKKRYRKVDLLCLIINNQTYILWHLTLCFVWKHKALETWPGRTIRICGQHTNIKITASSNYSYSQIPDNTWKKWSPTGCRFCCGFCPFMRGCGLCCMWNFWSYFCNSFQKFSALFAKCASYLILHCNIMQ